VGRVRRRSAAATASWPGSTPAGGLVRRRRGRGVAGVEVASAAPVGAEPAGAAPTSPEAAAVAPGTVSTVSAPLPVNAGPAGVAAGASTSEGAGDGCSVGEALEPDRGLRRRRRRVEDAAGSSPAAGAGSSLSAGAWGVLSEGPDPINAEPAGVAGAAPTS
jgi:hypothetical protein